MQKNTIYLSTLCPFCTKALKLLDKKNITYQKIIVNDKPEIWDEIKQKTGQKTVPQIFIGGVYIGGFDDLTIADMDGTLDKLISAK